MKLKKLKIKYLIYSIAFLLPIQTRLFLKQGEINGGYTEYGTLSLYGIDVLIFATVLVYLFQRRKKKDIDLKINSKTSFLFMIGALEFIVFMSILISDEKLISFYYYLRFLLAVGLFWLMVKSKYDYFKMMLFFIAGVSLQAIFGIWQFLMQSTFASKWLGMAKHIPFEGGTSVVEVLGEDGIWQRWLRAYGGQDHPNILGGLLVISILFIVYFLIKEKKSSKNLYLILSAIYCLLFTAAFFTFSRAAFLALVIGIFSMLFFAVVKKDLWAQLNILKVILISGVLFFVLFLSFNDLFLVRVKGGTRLETKSNTERAESYRVAREIIRENWFFGVGVGNYVYSLNKIVLDHKSWYYHPAHNTFLLVWAEIGLLGFIFFVAVLQLVFREIVKQYKKNTINIYKASILIALISLMMLDHWFWSLHFGIIFFWFILSLLYREDFC